MEEEEEEVLCYLDRVLEEEELFEYGDGELDPITPTHTQFKVRQWLDSWMQRGHAHVPYGSGTRCQERENSSQNLQVESIIGLLARRVISPCLDMCA